MKTFDFYLEASTTQQLENTYAMVITDLVEGSFDPSEDFPVDREVEELASYALEYIQEMFPDVYYYLVKLTRDENRKPNKENLLEHLEEGIYNVLDRMYGM